MLNDILGQLTENVEYGLRLDGGVGYVDVVHVAADGPPVVARRGAQGQHALRSVRVAGEGLQAALWNKKLSIELR